jgi:hypothetical protein
VESFHECAFLSFNAGREVVAAKRGLILLPRLAPRKADAKIEIAPSPGHVSCQICEPAPAQARKDGAPLRERKFICGNGSVLFPKAMLMEADNILFNLRNLLS